MSETVLLKAKMRVLKRENRALNNRILAYKELQEHTYSECVRYVNQLDSSKAIIEQLLESVALYQIECDDLNYEIQQYRTNNIFLLDLIDRLSS